MRLMQNSPVNQNKLCLSYHDLEFIVWEECLYNSVAQVVKTKDECHNRVGFSNFHRMFSCPN
jgi:hypothetical protein